MVWSLALIFALWLRPTVGDTCGGPLPTSGVITSPNYPSTYPRNAVCNWIISPLSKVDFYAIFTDNLLDNNYGCADNVAVGRIRNGQATTSQTFSRCSSVRSVSMSLENSDTVFVNFTSDGYSDYRTNRFRIVYFTLDPRIELIPDTQDKKKCLNGGTLTDEDKCLCPPGFSGDLCERACGPDRFGNTCEDICTGSLDGCRGRRICVGLRLNETEAKSYYSGPSSCSCPSGFMGSSCNKVCGRGMYGSNCTEQCGFCAGGDVCNPFTGHCVGGCTSGYHPPYCQQALKHLVGGLDIVDITDSSMSGHIRVTSNNTAGEGTVASYELQYKDAGRADEWSTGAMGPLCGAMPCSVPFAVDGLPSGTAMWVRVLLLDDNMQGYDNVPYLEVRTLGERQVSDLVLGNVTSHGMLVSWSSPYESASFWVTYECEALLACPGVRCDSDSGRMLVANKTVLLDNLLAFATYRVTVVVDDEAETAKATTQWAVPDTVPSDLKVTRVTNTSAVVSWSEALWCAALNGPATGYRWELRAADAADGADNTTALTTTPSRTSRTNKMLVVLRDLEPLTSYELRVSIDNVAGNNPDERAILLFKTMHTDEAVDFNNDDTMLWLFNNSGPFLELSEKWAESLEKRKLLQKSLSIYDYINKFPCLRQQHGWEMLTSEWEAENILTKEAVQTDWPILLNFLAEQFNKDKQLAEILNACNVDVPDGPVDLAVYRLNPAALWLRWLSPRNPGGKIILYLLHIQGHGEAHGAEHKVPTTSHCVAWPGSLCFAVHGLRAEVQYTITVRAVNEFGDEPGEPSTIISATRLGVPLPPRNLRLNDTRAREVTLEWQLPDFLNADLSHFEVVVTAKRGASTLPRKLDVNATEESLWYERRVPGLLPGVLYEAAVRCGWNGQAAVLHFTTLPAE